MNDTLSVELEVKDSVANGKLDAFVSKVRMVGKEIDNVGNNSSLGRALNSPLSADAGGLKRAYELEQASKAAAAGFKEVGASAANATSRAEALNAVVGLLPAEMQSAVSLAQGLSPAFLAAAGAVAVVGYAAINVAKEMREVAEQRLALEEKIQGAYNRQVFALRSATEEYEKQRRFAAETRQLDQQLKELADKGDAQGIAPIQKDFDARTRASLNQIQELKRLLEISEAAQKSAESRETSGFFARNSGVMKSLGLIFTEEEKRQQIAQAAEQIRKIKEALATAGQDLNFNRSGVGQADAAASEAQRNQVTLAEKAAKAEQERQEKFNKSVEQGKAKVEELHKAWDVAFDSLYQRANADNPFALFLQKSASESDKLKESLRGLPPELQKLAFAMKAVADGKDLFKLRIDSAVDAAGLRDDAEAFRNPAEPGRTPEQQKSRVEQKFFSAIQPGGYFGYNTVNPNSFTYEQKRQIAANQAYTDVMSDQRFAFGTLNQRGIAREAYRSYIGESEYKAPGFGDGKLAHQIAALEKFHPKTAGEQSEFDRKIIALTQGVDPLKLDDHTRTLAADARLHEASRQEQAEKDAEKNRKEDNDIRKKLADAVNKLADVANKEGVAGVDKKLEVTLKDETGGRATATTATPADVDLNYGTFSGSGGMTSY